MLLVDAAINLILGLLLVIFPLELFEFLGLPLEAPPFYASILGAVLVGIGIALLIEHGSGSETSGGLGLGGALTINLCAAMVLAAWLISGRISLPFRGFLVLGGLVTILVAMSGLEFYILRKRKRILNDGR